MKNCILLFAFGILFASLTACKKDDKSNGGQSSSAQNGTVKIGLGHSWEGQAFAPVEENSYINTSSGDTLNFTMFRYYISNVRLKKADGSFYTQPESYFLVNAADAASCILSLANVPAGTYTDLYYTFGIDSTRNVSGAQTGALDPVNQMFWSWSTGYIMLKAEGISPNSSSGSFAFHLGGFHGANSVVMEKHLSLSSPGPLSLQPSATKTVYVDVAVEKMWDNSPALSSVNDLQSPGQPAKTMAASFIGGMTFNHIE